MKTTYLIPALVAALVLSAGASSPVRAQNTGRNFVMTTVHTDADSTHTARRTVSYFDGLGRPVQTVQKGGSPDGHDLADRVEYDSLGRESRTWQTVRSPYSNGGPVDSAVFISAATGFYADTAPFRETRYDGSPLDRIRKVTGPGQAWHQAGKGVSSGFLTNSVGNASDSLHCKKYRFSLSGNTGITFWLDILHPWPSGSLSVSRTEDEDGRILWVFKDMRDLVVLERRLAEAAQGNTPAAYADTYYLYDDAGQLIAVLPPELSAYFAGGTWSGSTGTDPKVEGFAYQYRYDTRGRMIAKKLPGAAWTYYIYDKGDRLVLTQDGNQRVRGEWSFRLQDILGRECLTGILQGNYDPFNNPLANIQAYAIRNRSAGNYGALHGYTVTGLTLPSVFEVLTANWWDDYSFLGHQEGMPGTEYQYVGPTENIYGERYGTDAWGLLTGHWSKALGETPGDWDESAVRETWYYDDRGRTVRHVKGYPSGSRMTELSGYGFAGELTALGRTMLLSNDTTRTGEYAYTYDAWGRPLATTHSLDGGTPLLLSSNTYDPAGRLSQTSRGGTSAQNSPTELASSYTYNVRDWLTGINGSLFSETLTYETPRTGSSLAGQWGGNISSSQWQTSASLPDWKWYDYAYDALGRLAEARFGEMEGESPVDYKSTYEYDLNGNLERRTTLNDAGALANHEREARWTWSQTNGNRPTGWTQRQYDVTILSGTPPRPPQRIYQLDPSGNQEENYSYDPDGNRTATLDPQGDTLNVTAYNRLNLPEEYVTAAGDTVRYIYSADGEKLFVKEIPSAGSSTGTEYAANYRLDNNVLTMIHTDAGYYTLFPASPGGTGSVYRHFWYLKDHLGNNRVLADGSGDVYAVHHYDPYGGDIPVVSTTTTSSFPFGAKDSPYKYGDKEWNSTTSTYDFEARQLSPAFHRFTTMDPLAEKYYGISPYAYCANNPVNMVDPEGRYPLGYRILSGVIGAGADFGVQIGVNMLKGDDFNGAIKKVDWTSVVASGVTGAVSPKKTINKVVIGVTLVADAMVDVSAKDGVRYVGNTNEHNAKPVANAAIDAVVGVVGVQVGETVKNAVTTGLKNEASSQATATLTKQAKKQAKQLAEFAAKKGVQIAEGQAVSLSAKGGGEVVKQMPIEPPKEPIRLQFQQGHYYNPSSFGYIF